MRSEGWVQGNVCMGGCAELGQAFEQLSMHRAATASPTAVAPSAPTLIVGLKEL